MSTAEQPGGVAPECPDGVNLPGAIAANQEIIEAGGEKWSVLREKNGCKVVRAVKDGRKRVIDNIGRVIQLTGGSTFEGIANPIQVESRPENAGGNSDDGYRPGEGADHFNQEPVLGVTKVGGFQPSGTHRIG